MDSKDKSKINDMDKVIEPWVKAMTTLPNPDGSVNIVPEPEIIDIIKAWINYEDYVVVKPVKKSEDES